MSIDRLHCAQLPNIDFIRVGNNPVVYLAHAQHVVKCLSIIQTKRVVSTSLGAYLKSEAGNKITNGGDLKAACLNGSLVKMMYTYRLGSNGGGVPSIFLTFDGVIQILEDFPSLDSNAKARFKNVLRQCIQNTSLFEPVLSRVRSLLAPSVLRNVGDVNGLNRVDESTLQAEKRLKTSREGVYVLKFADGMKPSFYVGKSNDIARRIQQHEDGSGSGCVSGRRFSEVKPVTAGTSADMEGWERGEVLELMYQYGINAVRGWKFTFANMPLVQQLSAFDDVCERFDLCRRCGRGSHFVRDCEALTTDRWTNGLELRSFYRMQPIQGEMNEALEKAEAQVEEERCKRLAAERRNEEAIKILSAQSDR